MGSRMEGVAHPVPCSSDLVRNSEFPNQVLLCLHMCLPTGKGVTLVAYQRSSFGGPPSVPPGHCWH